MNKTLKIVLATLGVVVLLGGTFYGGMAYENHRIGNELKEAFSGFDDSPGEISDDADMSEDTEEETEVEYQQETKGKWFKAPPTEEGSIVVSVRVDSIECDQTTLKAEDDYTEDLTAKSGNVFCVLTATYKNTNDQPGSGSTFGNLITDKGEYQPDEDAEATFMPEVSELNPGENEKVKQYYQVPKGAIADAVIYQEDDAPDETTGLVTVALNGAS